MQEFNYYGSYNDALDIISNILNNTDLELIPDLNYKQQNYHSFREINDEVIEYVKMGIKLYFWNSRIYPIFPMEYFNNKGTFQIYESHCLIFSTSRYLGTTSNDEKVRCVDGSLSHTKSRFDSIKNVAVSIPDILIEEFKKVKSIMKDCLKKYKGKNIWFGKDAYQLFETGELEILYNGNYISKYKI